jgi:hypothetical protein
MIALTNPDDHGYIYVAVVIWNRYPPSQNGILTKNDTAYGLNYGGRVLQARFMIHADFLKEWPENLKHIMDQNSFNQLNIDTQIVAEPSPISIQLRQAPPPPQAPQPVYIDISSDEREE